MDGFTPEEKALFPDERIAAIRGFYSTRDRWLDILHWRTLTASVGKVDNVFYGDSITAAWPLHEFFPGHSLLNRGIGGDNVYGLYDRLEADVLAYSPRRVFMAIGINGIEEPADGFVARVGALTRRMTASGIRVALCGILPLRAPDMWDRCRFQEKIVQVNGRLCELAGKTGQDYVDYPSVLRDGSGQLAAECAERDGTHVRLEAYRRMAKLAKPLLA